MLQSSKLSQIEIKRTVSGKGNSKEIQTFLCPTKLPTNFEELALRPGLFLGSQINNKFIPSHHYSHVQNADESIELTKEEVVKYLKGETINKKCPDGYHFVSYMGMNLGVIYSLNGVLKNYYPKGLRFSASIDHSF